MTTLRGSFSALRRLVRRTVQHSRAVVRTLVVTLLPVADAAPVTTPPAASAPPALDLVPRPMEVAEADDEPFGFVVPEDASAETLLDEAARRGEAERTTRDALSCAQMVVPAPALSPSRL
jgi:hypothetical protein